MADTEPKSDEVLEQKQEKPVESTETAAQSNEEPASGDGDSPSGDANAAATGDDEVDDSYERYQYRRNRSEKDETRYDGVVRWFGVDRGYGFIEVKSDELGNPDAHVHGDNVELDSEGNIQILEEGQECTFTLLARPPPKSDPTGETKYTAKAVIPGKKKKKEKKIVKKYKGRCVFFNSAKEKRFGFIKIEPCDDYPTGVEVFVHQDSIVGGKGKGLVEEQEVECELATKIDTDANGNETSKTRAVNVKPGKAPPEDPEKDKIFSGVVVRWVEKIEKDGGKTVDKSFGFIRLNDDKTREVMVHNSKIVSGNKALVVTQKCKFRIQKRKDRNNPKAPLRESAIEVVPGDVPKKQVLTGVVRFFDIEKGFGFIQRKGQSDKDYFCRVESIIGPDKELEEKQTVTFVAAPSNRPDKFRAVEVKPGPKAVNGEVAELKPEETPFEAYLPAHTETVQKKKAKKKSNLPNHVQIQQDESLTEEEKAAALKKDFNYRKRMRRKRAQAREDESPPPAPQPKKKAAPPPEPEPAPVVKQQPAPQQSSSSKKKKSKAQKAQEQPQQPKQQPKQKKQEQQQQAAPAQTSSKKKKAKSQAAPEEKPKEKQQPKKQEQKQPQQQQAPLQTNKKKPKRRKNNKSNKGKSKAASQQEEEDVIEAYFEQNKKSRDAQNAAEASFFTMVYNYILSFCKTPPAGKRKLKH